MGREKNNNLKMYYFNLKKYLLKKISCVDEVTECKSYKKYKNLSNWNWELYRACRGVHMDLALLMIENICFDLSKQISGDNWNWGLWGACEGGHIELAHLMIQMGADDWNWGLWGACVGGHMDLAILMIQMGADNIGECLKLDFLKSEIRNYLLSLLNE